MSSQYTLYETDQYEAVFDDRGWFEVFDHTNMVLLFIAEMTVEQQIRFGLMALYAAWVRDQEAIDALGFDLIKLLQVRKL